ncbi:MAG: TonB-dependent receptor plug domain-containing protein [Hyphomicrobium sp.]
MDSQSCRFIAVPRRGRGSRRALSIAVIAAALAYPAHAQQAPSPDAQKPVQLPELLVEQSAAPPAKTKKKGPKHGDAAGRTPGAAAPVAASASATQHAAPTALANAGTPAAGVVPIFGAAGSPAAQTATAIDAGRLGNEPVFSVNDLLRQSPGVSLKQGNGPRDFGVSIRGSNARNGFGIRNIVILEDGFPVTQPDGLSRSDLVDPHAYAGIDVWRGPSSAMFGNYATGGRPQLPHAARRGHRWHRVRGRRRQLRLSQQLRERRHARGRLRGVGLPQRCAGRGQLRVQRLRYADDQYAAHLSGDARGQGDDQGHQQRP